MKKLYLTLLILLQSCWVPGQDLATFYNVIEKSNASPLQKKAIWEGCMAANTREFGPTSIRDISVLFVDEEGASNPEYKNSYSYGFYYCHTTRGLFSTSYTRSGWNIFGFKGDKIAYKSET